MEFDQLQKIWNHSSGEFIYGISERALQAKIAAKQHSAKRIAHISELVTILVNLGSSLFIAVINFTGNNNYWMYILAGWMLVTATFGFVHRQIRLRNQKIYQRTMLEDLQMALSDASSQLRLSRLMRLNILPVALFTTLGMWQRWNSSWLIIIAVVLTVVIYLAAGLEHGIYKRKKHELLTMISELESI